MTDGNDEPEASDEESDAEAGEGADEEAVTEASDEDVDAGTELSADTLESRLDDAAADLEAAETEADLDEVEAELDAVESDLEAADLPEPDEDEEDAEDPRADLEERLESLRADLEEARGPYAEDVVAAVEDAKSDVQGAQWTAQGVEELQAAVDEFADAVEDELGAAIDRGYDEPDFEDDPYVEGSDLDGLLATLDEATAAVEDAGLDPDEDAEVIADLLAAAETLGEDVEAATSWSDLSVRQQLDAHGYYDVLDHRKDFPPEWGALKVWAKRDRADMVLLAFEKFDSDFMENHALDALDRLGPEEALDAMVDMAQKRNRDAIRILGKIGSEEPVQGLLNYTDQESDPLLQQATLKALGQIGSEDATQAVADQLAAENRDVRSQAARSLGLIGDTRAVDPLADVLADDEEDVVRASAAWALVQIGTERALDVVADYDDDRAYAVQAEAKKAT